MDFSLILSMIRTILRLRVINDYIFKMPKATHLDKQGHSFGKTEPLTWPLTYVHSVLGHSFGQPPSVGRQQILYPYHHMPIRNPVRALPNVAGPSGIDIPTIWTPLGY